VKVIHLDLHAATLWLGLAQLLLGFSSCRVIVAALLSGFLGGVTALVKHLGQVVVGLGPCLDLTLQLGYQLVTAV